MTEKTVDTEVFNQLKANTGHEFVVELVETFMEEAPIMLAELRAARLDSDAGRFRRAAHSLKSNANTFGAYQLAALARDLEMRGLDTDVERDQLALVALEAEQSNVLVALKVLCHA
jgi:HPt (histidine-containing phosphotransfer) domain-containing protein